MVCTIPEDGAWSKTALFEGAEPVAEELLLHVEAVLEPPLMVRSSAQHPNNQTMMRNTRQGVLRSRRGEAVNDDSGLANDALVRFGRLKENTDRDLCD